MHVIDCCSVECRYRSAKARERHRGGGRAHIVVDVRAEEMRAIQMWIAEWKITHPDGVVGPWSRVESLQLHSSVEKKKRKSSIGFRTGVYYM